MALSEKLIIENIKKAQNQELARNTFYKNDNIPPYQNEFLFFIKPEITLKSDSIKLDDVLLLILNQVAKYDLHIKEASVLSADYLNEHNIIAQHYGVINKLSNNIRESISEAAIQKFQNIFDKDFNQAEVFGSLEFLKEFTEFTPLTLDYLWQNIKFEKLAGGTYACELNFNGRLVYLFNGFHPRQLNHFIEPGRSIVTMTLAGNINWDDAREQFIGATNPEIAEAGSLRNTFFKNEQSLGLPAMSSSWNGVHLSAGPVEGLIELMRYNSDFSTGDIKKPTDYQFGQHLVNVFGEEKANKILENCDVTFDGSNVSVFDLTEENNSNEAIDLLQKVSL